MGTSEKTESVTKTPPGKGGFSKFSPVFNPLGYRAAKSLLFQLDAEAAHHLTTAALSTATRLGINPRTPPPSGPDLETEVMGLKFPNPVGLAAGLDKNADCIDGFGALGFGSIEVGTLTPRPQPGNPKPRLFRITSQEAIINRMGFNNVGIEQGVANVRSRTYKGIIGINIGKNFDTPLEHATGDYLTGLRAAYRAADYVAVNLSSPNTAGLRKLQAVDSCRPLLAALKAEQQRLWLQHEKYTPVAIKIAPDVDDDHARALVDLFVEQKIDGVIATNTTISRDAVRGLHHGTEAGGLSGAPLTERSNAMVRLLAGHLGGALPIIGVGGIMTPQDALERLDSGAALVQLYTGLVYHGPPLIKEIIDSVRIRRNTSRANASIKP